MWNARILLKYTLLQLPELAIVIFLLMLVGQWIEISRWVFGGIIGVWMAKDIAFYPFVWRSYDWGRPIENNQMLGLTGTSQERLDPSGYVSVRGELWKAEVIRQGLIIEEGQNVYVKGIRGLTLLVESDTKEMDFK